MRGACQPNTAVPATSASTGGFLSFVGGTQRAAVRVSTLVRVADSAARKRERVADGRSSPHPGRKRQKRPGYDHAPFILFRRRDPMPVALRSQGVTAGRSVLTQPTGYPYPTVSMTP